MTIARGRPINEPRMLIHFFSHTSTLYIMYLFFFFIFFLNQFLKTEPLHSDAVFPLFKAYALLYHLFQKSLYTMISTIEVSTHNVHGSHINI